ncbi:hypothetical protein IHV10_22555 [Fictibacillus sp. 5RED26]|uniref:hypothetical protein n=1 Tax=Fictibacillus sp. 5RED26 TaxID=2745876 RepID=UPI0018CEB342|nr:hypothetical protein [Fictibacillus sp. 5RED26]MBH0159154.1 hypothetical protein [Fictibacillus sp. 5RED26]
MEKILIIVSSIYAIVSIFYTLSLRLEQFEWIIKRKNRVKVVSSRVKNNLSKEIQKLKNPNAYKKLLYINSKVHLLIIATILALGYITLVPPSNNIILKLLALICICILLYGLALYFNHLSKDTFENFSFYILKIFIIMTFSLAFVTNSLEFGGNLLFLGFSILFPLIYSFILMKSVMDHFKSILFQLFNFIFILGMVLFFWGLLFGSYYLTNNVVYQLFNEREYDQLMNHGDDSQIIFLVYKGLSPFYAFPASINIEQPLSYVPFIEFIVGYIFNAAFVGFFISYLVSKLIIREQEKTETTQES